ncbi:MAG: segregation/condensation protein A [Clostridia bacterium]|nr:segregation/condensation protein A [Clostridia bacterium]
MPEETTLPAGAAPTYKLEKFEGPLDLLLSLVQKNKMNIGDIQISVICEQYIEYIEKAAELNLELAVEFLVMASDLMLIKSRMLLPREEEEAEDPRAGLQEALARLQAAKKAAVILGGLYEKYRGRMEKEPEDISPDRTFVAENQDAQKLYEKMRVMISEFRAADAKIADRLVKPLVARPIVSVELKILGIMKHFEKGKSTRSTLGALLEDAENRPELVAIFIGVLELIKMKRLLIVEDPDDFDNLKGPGTVFEVNPDFEDDMTEGLVTDDYSQEKEEDKTGREVKKNGRS